MAAIRIADAHGLAAVSMRRVAAELGTGAASLYRYVDNRDDLIDMMTDQTGAEYALAPPTGDWLADLTAIGMQARAIMRRHSWLAAQVSVGAALGPHGLALLEHVLEVLAAHPAPLPAKLEAFAMMTALTALFVQNELAGGSERQQRSAAYLRQAVTGGGYPRLTVLLADAPTAPGSTLPGSGQPGSGQPGTGQPGTGSPDPADRFADLLSRVVTGLLGPDRNPVTP